MLAQAAWAPDSLRTSGWPSAPMQSATLIAAGASEAGAVRRLQARLQPLQQIVDGLG
jgi:hypothetical protein